MSVELQLFSSKMIPLIVLPEGLVCLALLGLVLSLARRAWRMAWFTAALALGVFWISATPTVAHWLMGTLERQHSGNPATLPRADAAILLGGAVSAPVPPRQVPELGEAVDRVWYAARLLRSGHVKKIVVVGGGLPWGYQGTPEAEVIRQLLVDLGVPASSIQIGTSSRNTYENALEAQALRKEQPFDTALLVTSAWHMPRALAIFNKAGLPVVPAPCDFRASDTLSGTILDWLPHADAFAMTSAAMREWLGFYVYRWRGWL